MYVIAKENARNLPISKMDKNAIFFSLNPLRCNRFRESAVLSLNRFSQIFSARTRFLAKDFCMRSLAEPDVQVPPAESDLQVSQQGMSF